MKIKNNRMGFLFSLLLLIGLSLPGVLLAEEELPTTTTSSTEISTTTLSTTTQTVTTTENSSFIPTVILDFAKLTIRIDNLVIFSDSVPISTATTTVTDNQNKSYDVAGNTVLGMLFNADTATTTFTITDLAYYSSFDSFIINCITVEATPSCYNWQYTVNDTYPYVGIDDYILKNNDDVYLYFGNQTRFNLSTTTITTAEPLGITSEKYDYRNNQWIPRPNVTIGATTPDPNNPWTPIVVTSTLTSDLGLANLYINATGTFNVGISEDYFYPTQSVVVQEIANIETATTTATSTASTEIVTSNNSGSGSNSGTVEIVPAVDLPKALEFLFAQQNKTTGAIGSGTLYNDWAAVAIGSYTNSNEGKNLLINYLKTDPSAGTAATDFERRAMALMSLGINPYSGTKTNYINEILKTYKNNQFGDNGLVNDDIFALFPLLKAGYTLDDAEIKNSVAFILSRQNQNGGWESPDLTAAAVQALSQVKTLSGVTDALAKAKTYLKNSTQINGSIGDNTFSTSWGIQAITALGESVSAWNGTNNSPLTYLAKQQQTDGGFESTTSTLDNRIWSTSYAIPAAHNKVWADILISFAKPVTQSSGDTITQTNSGNGGSGGSPEPITFPTTTIIIDQKETTSTVEKIEPTKNSANSIEPVLIESIGTSGNNDLDKKLPDIVQKIVQIEPKISLASPASTEEQNHEETIVPDKKEENLSVPKPATQTTHTREVFATATAVAGSAGAYLAWRFFQSLI